MENSSIIGKTFNLDLGSTPVEVKIINITDNKVTVEYLHSTPGRVEEFSISEFECFAMIKIESYDNEAIEKLIKEFKDLDSKYTLEEIIQSILDDDSLTDTGKLKFIRIRLEMDKANKGALEILETKLKNRKL